MFYVLINRKKIIYIIIYIYKKYLYNFQNYKILINFIISLFFFNFVNIINYNVYIRDQNIINYNVYIRDQKINKNIYKNNFKKDKNIKC